MSLPEVVPGTDPEVVVTTQDEIQPDIHGHERFEDWCPKYSVDGATPALPHQSILSSAPTAYDGGYIGMKNGEPGGGYLGQQQQQQQQQQQAWQPWAGGPQVVEKQPTPEFTAATAAAAATTTPLLCGFQRRLCILVVVIAVVVVTASIGGGVGGGIAAARGSQNMASSSSSSSSSATEEAHPSSTPPPATPANTTNPTATVTVATAVVPNTPIPQFLNNNTGPIGGFAFQAFSEPDYLGDATSVYMNTGFANLTFEPWSHVWLPNTTSCCITYCDGMDTATGYSCSKQASNNTKFVFTRFWIGCGVEAESTHACS